MTEYVYPMPPTMPPVINDAWSQAAEIDYRTLEAQSAVNELSLLPPQKLDRESVERLWETIANIRWNMLAAKHNEGN